MNALKELYNVFRLKPNKALENQCVVNYGGYFGNILKATLAASGVNMELGLLITKVSSGLETAFVEK